MPAKHIVFLALPGLQPLDLIGPLDVFHVATRFLKRTQNPQPGYQTTIAGMESEVHADSQLCLRTTPLEQVQGSIDTLVVPGGEHFSDHRFSLDAEVWFSRKCKEVRRIVSICSGAFFLAKLGLLDNRRCTTHWLQTSALQEYVPSAFVETDSLYVKDGPIYTSAGITAGIDLALSLVEDDLGHEVAIQVARLLVMFLHRPGGQSQFSAALTATSPTHQGVAAVRDYVIDHPEEDHRLPNLARRAGMSLRNFIRVFTQQTHETPAQFVQKIRIERAKLLLERTSHSLEEVATACGFGSAETMRRHFQQLLAISPTSYRERFAKHS
jgi:transcriptional regulator GlxA family with amidase domain